MIICTPTTCIVFHPAFSLVGGGVTWVWIDVFSCMYVSLVFSYFGWCICYFGCTLFNILDGVFVICDDLFGFWTVYFVFRLVHLIQVMVKLVFKKRNIWCKRTIWACTSLDEFLVLFTKGM